VLPVSARSPAPNGPCAESESKRCLSAVRMFLEVESVTAATRQPALRAGLRLNQPPAISATRPGRHAKKLPRRWYGAEGVILSRSRCHTASNSKTHAGARPRGTGHAAPLHDRRAKAECQTDLEHACAFGLRSAAHSGLGALRAPRNRSTQHGRNLRILFRSQCLRMMAGPGSGWTARASAGRGCSGRSRSSLCDINRYRLPRNNRSSWAL